MRQIGMRQEASRLGGIGSCGRELCCSTWLTDFKTVSTSAARYQNLSLNTLKLAGQCGKLKCCLNYELDTYMDALKDIPDNADRLETGKGTARLQKTDIFKKLMWFSYPNEESWIPLPLDRVKEIQQLNKKGTKPDDLREAGIDIPTAPSRKEPDYENVVGQDSLTRLDDPNRRKKKNNNRNKNRSQSGQSNPNNPKPGAPQGPKPEQGANPGNNVNPNRNPNNRNPNNRNLNNNNNRNPNRNPNNRNPNNNNGNTGNNNNNRNNNDKPGTDG